MKERRGRRDGGERSASSRLNAEQTRSLNSWTVKGEARGSEASDMDERMVKESG